LCVAGFLTCGHVSGCGKCLWRFCLGVCLWGGLLGRMRCFIVADVEGLGCELLGLLDACGIKMMYTGYKMWYIHCWDCRLVW